MSPQLKIYPRNHSSDPLLSQGINLYRLLRGYVWLAANPGPAVYFGDLSRWDNIAHDAINAIVTWIGDSLMVRSTTESHMLTF